MEVKQFGMLYNSYIIEPEFLFTFREEIIDVLLNLIAIDIKIKFSEVIGGGLVYLSNNLKIHQGIEYSCPYTFSAIKIPNSRQLKIDCDFVKPSKPVVYKPNSEYAPIVHTRKRVKRTCASQSDNDESESDEAASVYSNDEHE